MKQCLHNIDNETGQACCSSCCRRSQYKYNRQKEWENREAKMIAAYTEQEYKITNCSPAKVLWICLFLYVGGVTSINNHPYPSVPFSNRNNVPSMRCIVKMAPHKLTRNRRIGPVAQILQSIWLQCSNFKAQIQNVKAQIQNGSWYRENGKLPSLGQLGAYKHQIAVNLQVQYPNFFFP